MPKPTTYAPPPYSPCTRPCTSPLQAPPCKIAPLMSITTRVANQPDDLCMCVGVQVGTSLGSSKHPKATSLASAGALGGGQHPRIGGPVPSMWPGQPQGSCRCGRWGRWCRTRSRTTTWVPFPPWFKIKIDQQKRKVEDCASDLKRSP